MLYKFFGIYPEILEVMLNDEYIDDDDVILDIQPIRIDKSYAKPNRHMKPTPLIKLTLPMKLSASKSSGIRILTSVRQKIYKPSAFKPPKKFKLASNKPSISDPISCMLLTLVHSVSVNNINHVTNSFVIGK